MTYTKDELIKISGPYFKDRKINKMLATPDGNFFYPHAVRFADSHAKTIKKEVITIIRDDLRATESKDVEVDEKELAALRKEAKGLKIKGYNMMKAPKLKEKIAEAKK